MRAPPPAAVLIKYVNLMLRADDNGEGGRQRRAHNPRRRPAGSGLPRSVPVGPPMPCAPPPAGGIFALYALICRAAGIRSAGSLAHEADLSLSQYTRAPAEPAGASAGAHRGGLCAAYDGWRRRVAARARG